MITDNDDPVTTPIERFRRIIPNALTDYGFVLNTADPTPRLVLNSAFLPKITEKGSGARTFVVRTVPRETVRTAMYLIDAVNPSGPDALSILRIFEEFKRMNSTVAGEDELLLLFAVDLMIQKIKASSVGTYVASIQRMRKRQNCAIHGPLVKDLKKIVAMLQCDDEIDHAVDITEEEAYAFMYTLSGQAQLARRFSCWSLDSASLTERGLRGHSCFGRPTHRGSQSTTSTRRTAARFLSNTRRRSRSSCVCRIYRRLPC